MALKRPIQPEDALLFALTRQDLDERHAAEALAIQRDPGVEWERIFRTAQRHGVTPLIAVNLKHVPELRETVPHELLKKFETCVVVNQARKRALEAHTRDVLEFLAVRELPVMVLKGGALDRLVYREPWYTMAADVDLVIGRREDDVPVEERDAIRERIRANSAYIEFDYFEHHDVVTAGRLPIDFERIWREARPLDYLGQPVLMMSAEDTLLSLCINSCRKRYFGLKSLLHITECVRGFPELGWERFVEVVREARAGTIAYTALLAARDTLGCAVPEETLRALPVSRLRRAGLGALCRRMSFSTLESLYSGTNVRGRKVSAGLLLPYASFSFAHLWRTVSHVYREMRAGISWG